MTDYKIILFYKFINLKNPKQVLLEQRMICSDLNLKGRVILGKEGINGTLEGKVENIEKYIDHMHKHELFSDIKFKSSEGFGGKAFPKLSVKIRDEIVTLKKADIHPEDQGAEELPAEKLQEMYDNNEDFVVLDMRNDYEILSGYFDKTINPGIRNFRDLFKELEEIEGDLKKKTVVTVCTGGIRCEKATKAMKKRGYKKIYQLKDGIHTYMEKFPGKNFKGTLYVFDNRMTTDVVKSDTKEIVGRCEYCKTPTEKYACDDSVRPSKRILCCAECFEQNKEKLRDAVSV